jgi:hypothetical protein
MAVKHPRMAKVPLAKKEFFPLLRGCVIIAFQGCHSGGKG